MVKATKVAPKANVPAVRKTASSEVAMPDFMKQDAGAGREGLDRSDIETPRLKLMQGLSPELETYDKLRPGMFFHTAAEHIFDGPFKAVPLYISKSYLLWNPRDSGGGILARADDAVHWSPADTEFEVKLDAKDGGHKVKWKTAKTVTQSGLANWGTMNPNDPQSPPAATLMYNYVLAFPEFPDLMPAVMTFQRSSIKAGRQFNSKLMTVRSPIFGCVFEFSSEDTTNKRGQNFKNVSVVGAGFVTDKALYEQYRDLNRNFTETGLTIRDVESLQDEADADPDEADEEPEKGKGGKSKPKY